MILEIGVDRSQKKAIVEGKLNHSQSGKGVRTLRWMCDPDGDHASWRVKFTNGSPFKNGKAEFGGSHGADGGVLKVLKKEDDGEEPQHYSYDVWCTDNDGTTYDTDPEVVLWPV